MSCIHRSKGKPQFIKNIAYIIQRERERERERERRCEGKERGERKQEREDYEMEESARDREIKR